MLLWTRPPFLFCRHGAKCLEPLPNSHAISGTVERMGECVDEVDSGPKELSGAWHASDFVHDASSFGKSCSVIAETHWEHQRSQLDDETRSMENPNIRPEGSTPFQ